MKSRKTASKPFVESLESRRFLSATVHPSLLGPSAVEGTYVGTVTADGITKEVKLTITSTAATLTVVGEGTRREKLTTREFDAIRKGSVDESGSYKGYTYKIDGAFNSTGTKINGTLSVSSSLLSVSGSASLHKVSS
jgi:hypothetical protein